MLSSLRKGAGTWIAKIFIGLLACSFAVWGIADIFGGYGRQTVATVGDSEISDNDYRQAYQAELNALSRQLSKQLTPQQARLFGLHSRVLSRLIAGAALDSHARELRLGITDKAIADGIRRDKSFFDESGQFNRTRFIQLLRAEGLSEQGYVARQRKTAVRQQLVLALTNKLTLPESLVRSAYLFLNERRTVEYFSLPASAAGEHADPKESELKDYHQAHKQAFALPEFRKLSLLRLEPKTIQEKIEIDESEIKSAYEDRKGSYISPERRRIEQISFDSMGQAEEASQKLTSGTDFLDLAKQLGFSASDVKIGRFAKSGLVDRKVADVAFALGKDEISAPIEGNLAIVIVRTTDITPEVVRSYEEAKEDIRKALAKNKAGEEILDLHDAIEDERAAGTTLKEIAEKLDLAFLELPLLDLLGNNKEGVAPENLPAATELMKAAFKSDVGVENDPVEVAGGGHLWFEVLEVVPSRTQSLDEIRQEVEKEWRQSEQKNALRKVAQKWVIDIREGKKNLQEAASAFGKTVLTSSPFRRNSQPSGLPESLIQQSFALPREGISSNVGSDNKGRLLFRVSEITPPGKLIGTEKEKIQSALEGQMADDFLAQYVTALQDRYGVNINQATLNLVTGADGGPSGQNR